MFLRRLAPGLEDLAKCLWGQRVCRADTQPENPGARAQRLANRLKAGALFSQSGRWSRSCMGAATYLATLLQHQNQKPTDSEKTLF